MPQARFDKDIWPAVNRALRPLASLYMGVDIWDA